MIRAGRDRRLDLVASVAHCRL